MNRFPGMYRAVNFQLVVFERLLLLEKFWIKRRHTIIS